MNRGLTEPSATTKTRPGWGWGWGGLGLGVYERAERGAEPRMAGARRPKVTLRDLIRLSSTAADESVG